VIGDDAMLDGPFGPRRLVYADHTASGRALSFIEDYIRGRVLPLYANTHTEASATGLHTTALREDARGVIHPAVGGSDQAVVLFCGSGSTAAIDTLKIGSFSAASNVTGIVTDVEAVSGLLRRHGALSCWDYAAAGPYLPIDMTGKDAVFLSPHRFVGGPGTPGVLVAKRAVPQPRSDGAGRRHRPVRHPG